MKTAFPGNFRASDFLRDCWQKQPLLVKNAFPGFDEPFTPAEIFKLAARDDAESRLIRKDKNHWTLAHGPFAPALFKRLPKSGWTVLVQDTQHFSQAAKTLLQRFSFIPHARVDDLMVSYAAKGGGVGPHFDSYDVFLLQGTGRRRWRISAQADRSVRLDLPVKILANFKPEQEWVLHSGDMLYLPPGYAHEGVALDECITYSIGFRAPTHQELATAFLDFLRDEVELAGQYADPELRAATHPGEIPPALRRSIKKTLRSIRWDDTLMERFIGRYLSEPKSHVVFESPQAPLSIKQLTRVMQLRGVLLDPKTRMLFSGRRIFLNGEAFEISKADAPLFRVLADRHALPPAPVSHTAAALFYDWYLNGFLHTN